MEGYCGSDRAFHIDAFHVYEIKDEEDEGCSYWIRGFNNIHTTPVLTRTATPRVVPSYPSAAPLHTTYLPRKVNRACSPEYCDFFFLFLHKVGSLLFVEGLLVF